MMEYLGCSYSQLMELPEDYVPFVIEESKRKAKETPPPLSGRRGRRR